MFPSPMLQMVPLNILPLFLSDVKAVSLESINERSNNVSYLSLCLAYDCFSGTYAV